MRKMSKILTLSEEISFTNIKSKLWQNETQEVFILLIFRTEYSVQSHFIKKCLKREEKLSF